MLRNVSEETHVFAADFIFRSRPQDLWNLGYIGPMLIALAAGTLSYVCTSPGWALIDRAVVGGFVIVMFVLYWSAAVVIQFLFRQVLGLVWRRWPPRVTVGPEGITWWFRRPVPWAAIEKIAIDDSNGMLARITVHHAGKRSVLGFWHDLEQTLPLILSRIPSHVPVVHEPNRNPERFFYPKLRYLLLVSILLPVLWTSLVERLLLQ